MARIWKERWGVKKDHTHNHVDPSTAVVSGLSSFNRRCPSSSWFVSKVNKPPKLTGKFVYVDT